MYSQLEEKSKRVLDAVNSNPGLNSRQLNDILTKTHTLPEVSSSVWGLWRGRYITRKKGDTKIDNGMTPLVYYFKTEKPRMKKRGKAKRKYVRKFPQSRVNEVFNPTVTPASTPKVSEVKNTVEILIAVPGSKDTIMLTPGQARDLCAALKDLLGA